VGVETSKHPTSPAAVTESFYADADEEAALKDSLEQSVTQWHDAEGGLKGLDLERSAKKRISDVSLLSDETEIFDNSTDDKNDTNELLNDTIEEMERILVMGVDYLDKQDNALEVKNHKKYN